jgi:Skp family chaperone for outer membrane proteins
MKQIRQQTISLKQQIASNTSQLTAIINDIETGKKTLPSDLLNTLLSDSQKLKSDINNVETTTGINQEVSNTQDEIDNKDFNNALSSLDKVISRLQSRLNTLSQLNTDLDAVLEIANQATTPAPASSTPTPTNSNTSSSGTSTNSSANSSTTEQQSSTSTSSNN